MGTSVGVGHSVHRNPAVAGKEAAECALGRAGIAIADFIIVFATVGYDQPQLIAAVRGATSNAPLCGCSGEGIITDGIVAETNFGVCVMAIASDEIRFDTACVSELHLGADRAGEALADALRCAIAPDTKACFVLADGLAFNFDPFLATFEESLDREAPLPILGGLAADNWASQKTFQYLNDEILSEGMVSFAMSGGTQIAWGINHGCVPVGTKRTITRCKGNVILEIDGVPALEALKEYLDPDWMSQWKKSSLNLCLGFKAPDRIKDQYEEFVIRYMVSKDDADGSVTIQSEVEPGTELWIVRRDKELIQSGMQAIARQIKAQLGGEKPKFFLQFECVGRGKVVFLESEKEAMISALQRELGSGIPWIGFYTYGEIGPTGRYNSFHNFTTVLAAVY